MRFGEIRPRQCRFEASAGNDDRNGEQPATSVQSQVAEDDRQQPDSKDQGLPRLQNREADGGNDQGGDA